MSNGITLTETKPNYYSSPESSQTSGGDTAKILDAYSDLPILLPRLSSDYDQKDAVSAITETLHGNNPPATIYYTPTVPDKPLFEKTFIDFEDGIHFHSLCAHEADGTPFDFLQLKGKYVLIVNVASMCGFSWQMRFLNDIHIQYGEDVVVLGFPSNNFCQEWLSAEKAAVCYRSIWKCQFKIMEKVRVNGAKEHEVFKYLKDKKKGIMGSRRIKWNFEKFLVDRNGKIIRRYSSFKIPQAIMDDLDKILECEKIPKMPWDMPSLQSRYRKFGMGHPLETSQEIIYI